MGRHPYICFVYAVWLFFLATCNISFFAGFEQFDTSLQFSSCFWCFGFIELHRCVCSFYQTESFGALW
jgi:hypothetical protein